MQGTRVRAPVREDPTCRGAARPVSHNYWACASGACAPQQEGPRQWEARAPWWRVAPTCRNWRKPSCRNEDPTQTWINKIKLNFKKNDTSKASDYLLTLLNGFHWHLKLILSKINIPLLLCSCPSVSCLVSNGVPHYPQFFLDSVTQGQPRSAKIKWKIPEISNSF